MISLPKARPRAMCPPARTALAVMLLLCLAAPRSGLGQVDAEERRIQREQLQKASEERIERLREEARAKQAARQAAEDREKAVAEQVSQLKEAAPAELMLRNTSQIAALFFEPADISARVGEPFAADITLRCQSQRVFTEVDLIIEFDPLILTPLDVHDDALRPLLAEDPVFESGPGRLRYSARLKEPAVFFTQRLLTVVWRPERAARNTRVRLESAQQRSSVRAAGVELLTGELLPRGALLALDVTILPQAPSYKQGFIAAGEGGALNAPGFVRGPIWLELDGPATLMPPGAEFDVRVFLRNPQFTQFDTVSVVLRYPTERAEILDWDRGNWIRAGINIHDAPAHELFPFDFHLANEVDLLNGRIIYRKGMTRTPLTSEGFLAEMRVRALKPVSVVDFQFVHDPGLSGVATDVTFLGASLLQPAPAPAAADSSISADNGFPAGR